MGERMNGVDLLNRRVVMRGIELGRVVDVILDESTGRAIGLDVRCGDGAHRFLPLPAAQVDDGDVEVDSPLVLLETDQVDFYRSRGRALRSST
jgi:sporulation protein YlmC with PRC-barrel domain